MKKILERYIPRVYVDYFLYEVESMYFNKYFSLEKAIEEAKKNIPRNEVGNMENNFLIGDVVKVKEKNSRKIYIITSISEDGKFAYITLKNKKYNLIKIEISKLKLISRNQVVIEV